MAFLGKASASVGAVTAAGLKASVGAALKVSVSLGALIDVSAGVKVQGENRICFVLKNYIIRHIFLEL